MLEGGSKGRKPVKPKLLYFEDKSESLNGVAWIGWGHPSKSGRTIRYGEREFRKVKWGYKFNHVEVGTGKHFWISGCRKDGADRLYASNLPVTIDEDAKDYYWKHIRGR